MLSRWILFILAILVGIAGGLAYAWKLNPVEYVNTTPESLRIDYKSDYVLMVAEVYNVDGNLDQAARRLALLGNVPPAEIVRQTIQSAEENGYYADDLVLMRSLYGALQGPGAQESSP